MDVHFYVSAETLIISRQIVLRLVSPVLRYIQK